MTKDILNNPELNEIRRKYQAVTQRQEEPKEIKKKTLKQLCKKWEENSKC